MSVYLSVCLRVCLSIYLLFLLNTEDNHKDGLWNFGEDEWNSIQDK